MYNNVAGAMTDNDGDVADSGGPFMAVMHLSWGYQNRAFAEHDLRGLALEHLTQGVVRGAVFKAPRRDRPQGT